MKPFVISEYDPNKIYVVYFANEEMREFGIVQILMCEYCNPLNQPLTLKFKVKCLDDKFMKITFRHFSNKFNLMTATKVRGAVTFELPPNGLDIFELNEEESSLIIAEYL